MVAHSCSSHDLLSMVTQPTFKVPPELDGLRLNPPDNDSPKRRRLPAKREAGVVTEIYEGTIATSHTRHGNRPGALPHGYQMYEHAILNQRPHHLRAAPVSTQTRLELAPTALHSVPRPVSRRTPVSAAPHPNVSEVRERPRNTDSQGLTSPSHTHELRRQTEGASNQPLPNEVYASLRSRPRTSKHSVGTIGCVPQEYDSLNGDISQGLAHRDHCKRSMSESGIRNSGVHCPSIAVTCPTECDLRKLDPLKDEPDPPLTQDRTGKGLRRLRARESLRNLAKIVRGEI